MATKYFSNAELADKETGIVKLAFGFGDRIDSLREAWEKPLLVNSCCRTADRNKRIGGHPQSLHVYDYPFHRTGGSCAIDFSLMKTNEEMEQFKQLALDMGFSVGDERNCIHIDDRTRVIGLPQKRFFYGKV